jgi:hypothetical protein
MTDITVSAGTSSSGITLRDGDVLYVYGAVSPAPR